MSVCGNCPFPTEAELYTEEDCGVCSFDCTFEDAAYRAQWAYDQLFSRFIDLERKYKKLMEDAQ